MALKFFSEAREPYVVADTAEEMASLLKSLRRSSPGLVLPLVQKNTLPPNEAFTRFWQDINSNAKRFLAELVVHRKGIRGDQFSELIKMPVEKFGGVLGGASKIAKKYQINFTRIVRSEMRTEGTTRFRWLEPGPLLTDNQEAILTDVQLKVGA